MVSKSSSLDEDVDSADMITLRVGNTLWQITNLPFRLRRFLCSAGSGQGSRHAGTSVDARRHQGVFASTSPLVGESL